MRKMAQRFIRVHNRWTLMKIGRAVSEKYLRAWYNENTNDFSTNGEKFVLECLLRWGGDEELQIWDVGAHEGEWALEAHSILPQARIASFELLPPLAETISKRFVDQDWHRLCRVGLSDHQGEVLVTWNKSFDTTNAIHPRLISQWFSAAELEHVTCETSTVDAMVAAGDTPPHFLKIDTEGHDAFVIAGAECLLRAANAPVLIQFEYGDTWIPGGKHLFHVWKLLADCGYSIGRLYPRYVDFKEYEFRDDNFRMGNIIAVRDARLRAFLAN